ncbi:MAG: phosphocholine cytidylyltransferase family protein [Lachnospiraceae bacterium]|nr:phosphocholine cytidylyltransferase family protein [Lachnospiraceae bacterium]
MQAIILAAGMGKRLKEYTQDNTKCMVKVNGVTMIERLLRQLDDRRLDRIIIVVGYEGRKLEDYVRTLGIATDVEFVNNPIYDKTNNIYSLALAKDFLLEDDTVLFESDLIFEDRIISAVFEDSRDTLAVVAKYEPWMDGTCVMFRDDGMITRFIPKKDYDRSEIDKYYKTVNVYKLGKEFSRRYYVPFMDAYRHALGENEYYEQVFRIITMLDEPLMGALCLKDEKWYEIDNAEDLANASRIFEGI